MLGERRNGIQYRWESPFFVYLKGHACPKCGDPLMVISKSKTVHSGSAEAESYGGTDMHGWIEFNTKAFFCEQCRSEFSIKEIRRHERQEKKNRNKKKK